MKKKIFLFLAILLCLGAALVLTACGGEPAPTPAPVCQHRDADDNALCDKCGESYTDGIDVTPPGGNQNPGGDQTPGGTEAPHTHALTRHAAVASTCTTEGCLEYWECTACSKFFPDSSANAELANLHSMALPALGHDPVNIWKSDETGHWQDCTRTGCGAQLNKTAHTYGNWVETLAPTCVAEGSHYRDCTACAYRQTEAIPIDASKHAPASTWTTDGTHHWKVCTRTGCDARVNEAAHTPAVAWSSDATNHWHDCTACGYDINLIAHTYDAENTCACQHYKDAGVKFTLKNGTYAVTDYTGTATEVIIPSKYKGIAVTAIGDYAFYDCTGLQSITIPAGVTTIGYKAFIYCSGLQSITIPASVTTIGDDAFGFCSNLTAVCITDLAAWCNIDFGNASVNPLYYAKNLYLNGQLVTNLEIPSGVTAIKDYAFCCCSSLQSITIPASVTTIGDYAFRNCSSLQSITIPEGVTSIGDDAFDYCSGLQTVTFGANSQLTTIGDKAFYGCSGLQSITIPEGVTSIGYRAFNSCRSLESIIVESGNTVYHSAGNCLIETASKTLIQGCKNSVIPTDGSVTTIGECAFYYCTGLQSITIPASVTTIGDYAFENCSSLQSITIPAGVTAIGYWAFHGCSKLTSVIFENPNGWWVASSSSATSGRAVSATDLDDTDTAATYLKSTYDDYYWKRG